MRLIDADKIRYSDLSDGLVPDGVWCTWKDRIDDMPTVKAIPIEWIRDYIKKHTFTFRIYDTTNENNLDAITTNEFTLVSKMLEDWEKENEIDRCR